MPYKARLKTGEPRKREKPGYRVTNARAYNQSLRKRGMISLYVPDGDLKARLINAKVRTPGVSGREPTCTMAYIEVDPVGRSFVRMGTSSRATDAPMHF